MSNDLYYSDLMILKRCSDAAKEVGGLDKIKADRWAALIFKDKTQSDFDLLARRYGRREAAGLIASAIRSIEKMDAENIDVTVH